MNDRRLSSEEAQEADEQERQRIVREGHEARQLLEHPLVVRFFGRAGLEAVNQFANLAWDAPEKDLRAALHRLKNLHEFQQYFERMVSDATDTLIREKHFSDDIDV